MSTNDVPGLNPKNRDELHAGCWAEHDNGTLIYVLGTEGNKVIYDLFEFPVGGEPVMWRCRAGAAGSSFPGWPPPNFSFVRRAVGPGPRNGPEKGQGRARISTGAHAGVGQEPHNTETGLPGAENPARGPAFGPGVQGLNTAVTFGGEGAATGGGGACAGTATDPSPAAEAFPAESVTTTE